MTATHTTLPCRLCSKSVLPSTAAKTSGLCLDCFYEEKARITREARASHPGCVACDGSGTAEPFWFDAAIDMRIRMFTPADWIWWRVHQRLHGRRAD